MVAGDFDGDGTADLCLLGGTKPNLGPLKTIVIAKSQMVLHCGRIGKPSFLTVNGAYRMDTSSPQALN